MRLSALLLVLIALPVLPGAARTFEETGGGSLEGDIATASPSTVTIRTRNGALTKLPLARLSKADRAFVARWLAEPLPELRVTPHFAHAHEGGEESREVLGLAVKVGSPGEATPLDTRLNYFLIGRCMEDPDRYKVLSVQSIDLTLHPGKVSEGSFRPVANHYVSAEGRGKGAQCIGYVLQTTRRSDGRELHSVGSIPLLQQHLDAILALEIGDETTPRFLPLDARTPGGSRTLTTK